MRYTKKQFEAEYPDDDACLESVFQNRFGDLKFCPKCAAETKFYRIKKRQAYACQWCGYQLHPLADTIFRKTTTPLKDWFYAIYLFSVSKNGVSAKELERHLGVTYKTAWRIAKQIRLLMAQDAEKLSGVVEADETFVGRKWDKKPIYGAVEKKGRMKTMMGEKATTKEARIFIGASLETGSELQTDTSPIYKWTDNTFKHETVNHMRHEYVRDGVTTNTLEGFWGNIKRSMTGTYHYVSPKYLSTYVDEFVFRYNFRDVAVCPVLLELAAKPFLSAA